MNETTRATAEERTELICGIKQRLSGIGCLVAVGLRAHGIDDDNATTDDKTPPIGHQYRSIYVAYRYALSAIKGEHWGQVQAELRDIRAAASDQTGTSGHDRIILEAIESQTRWALDQTREIDR